jgi:CubicO group peptidase (beta-lactamase class C family)
MTQRTASSDPSPQQVEGLSLVSPLRFSTVEELRLHVGRLSHASRHLNSWVSSREIPAASLLVGRRGCFLAPLFFGHHADRADASPLRGDAIFLIASITKPIVALAALQLVERGELALDDRVERYIPHFGKQGKHGITVRHLLTHTSGLPDMLPNNLELRGEQAPLSAFVEGACRLTPEFPAGRSVQYQSLGFAVLGEIIQRVSGLTCGAWLKQHLFDPLGMADTALGAPDSWFDGPKPRVGRIAELRLPPEQIDAPHWNWNSRYWRQLGAPWGGLLTTPTDLGRLAAFLLGWSPQTETQVLSRLSIAAATRNQL